MTARVRSSHERAKYRLAGSRFGRAIASSASAASHKPGRLSARAPQRKQGSAERFSNRRYQFLWKDWLLKECSRKAIGRRAKVLTDPPSRYKNSRSDDAALAKLTQQIDPGRSRHIYVENQAVNRKGSGIAAELLCRSIRAAPYAMEFEQHFERLSKSCIVIDNMHDGLSHFEHPQKFTAEGRFCRF